MLNSRKCTFAVRAHGPFGGLLNFLCYMTTTRGADCPDAGRPGVVRVASRARDSVIRHDWLDLQKERSVRR